MSAYYWPRWYTAGMKDPQPSRPAKAPACYEPGVHRCKNVFGLDMACAECPWGQKNDDVR